MAHLCPNCDATCTCSGDWSPIIAPRAVDCGHCDALDQLADEDPEAFDDVDDDVDE